MKHLLLLIFFEITAAVSFAQDFQYKTYTEQDGLTNNTITDILQDSSGFLWIATSNGLNRFDGNFFDHFYNNHSDTGSIASNEIQSLFIDREKRLWVGTAAGISLYHPVLQSFSNYAPDTLVLPVIGVSFQALCDDTKGNLWVGTKNDLLIFNPETKKFKSSGWVAYANKVCLTTGNRTRVIIMSVIKKSENELWVLSTYGLFSVNTNTLSFTFYPYPPIIDFYETHLYYADDSGNVWINLVQGGILCYNYISNQWTRYHAPSKFSKSDRIKSIKEYNQDTLVYCADRSFIFFSKKNKNVIEGFTHGSNEVNSLPDADFTTIRKCGGFLWLGTNHGLVKISPQQNLFKFHSLASPNSISRIFHSSITNNLFVGEDKTGATIYVKKEGGAILPVYTEHKKPVHGDYVYFKETATGDAYVNGDEALFYYNSKTNLASEITLPQKRFPQDNFDLRNTVIDKEGTVWTRSVEQGIIEYNPQTKKIAFNENIPITAGNQINTLYYDSLTNCLWLSKEFEGLLAYNIKTKKLQHYLLNIPPSQKGAGIVCITGDGKGNIYCVDYHQGIIHYNSTTQKFIRFSVSDGLISDNCFWLSLDSKGYLWISATNGISRMDVTKKTFTNYYTNEGFPSTYPFLSSDKEGNVYMPFGNGYYQWNTNDFTGLPTHGNLYLRSVEISGKNIPVDTVYSLNYSENNIKFRFGDLVFRNNIPVTFEYRLNKNNWQNADQQGVISFASLSPGNYDLSLREKSFPVSEIHIHFFISPPWWQHIWFEFLIVALLAFVVIFFVRRRVKTIRRDATFRQRISELEMSALRSQMNPHFIFNTLNSINSYIIENKSEEASEYLTEFSQLMRIILEHSKQKLVALSDELKALKLYLELESKRLEKSFDYKVEISPDTDVSDIEVPPLIMQPFVENAIWHGLRNKRGSGCINIRIEKHEDKLLISIIDDGIGRENAKKFQKANTQSSFGIQATLKRLLLHYPNSQVKIEDLYNEKMEPLGTRVNIFLIQKDKS